MKEIRFLKVRKSQLNSDNLVVKRQIENFLSVLAHFYYCSVRQFFLFGFS